MAVAVEKLETYNHDIAGLVRRLDRFMFELHKSVSSGTSQVNEFDIARLESYLAALNTYLGWVISQPQLDLPESHPRSIAIDAEPTLGDVESESINDIIRIMKIARYELVNSQSSRDPASLNKFDLARVQALVGKMEQFIGQYIRVATPLDMPESSPALALSGPGKIGV